MPYRAARPCSVPGCPNKVSTPGVYRCPEHQREYERNIDEKRGTPAKRGYDAKWRRIRARFLADNPNCEMCGRPATIAHHIKRRVEGGEDSPRNLMGLCASCHSTLHAKAGHNWNKDEKHSKG